MSIEKEIFKRTELLIGVKKMNEISKKRVIIVGVGGVGSWCAESLVRSGIQHLTIVDSDRICISNVNRQLPATTKTVGEVKVDVLKRRLLEINPNANIIALQQKYNEDTFESFELGSYDYIIDAIDSLKNKVHLIHTATKTKAKLFSSMGAALKIDPTRIQVAEFWKVRGCPLGAALRRKLKKEMKPSKKFLCVFSDELLDNKGENSPCSKEYCNCSDTDNAPGNPELANHTWNTTKAQINGTFSHITAIFGFTLAGLVMKDIYKKEE